MRSPEKGLQRSLFCFFFFFFFFFIGVYVFAFYMFDEISMREFGFKIKTHDQFNYLFRLNLFHK
jgi:hypothetical protein